MSPKRRAVDALPCLPFDDEGRPLCRPLLCVPLASASAAGSKGSPEWLDSARSTPSPRAHSAPSRRPPRLGAATAEPTCTSQEVIVALAAFRDLFGEAAASR